MNHTFPLHTLDNCLTDAEPSLQETENLFGMIPNLEAVMAAAPPLLTTYVTGESQFEKTTLSPVEREVVMQTVNFENTCNYCVPWHTFLSEKAGMSTSDIKALRDNTPLSKPRLEALRRFTKDLVAQRGRISHAELQAFFQAGYDARQALEVILGIAIKTMSNFTNAIAGTTLDEAVENRRWHKPLPACGHGPA